MKRFTFCLLLVACGNSNKSSTDAPSSVDSPLTVDAPVDGPRQPPATTFDCVHGWLFEADDTGTIVPSPYSELGVCMKWSRYTDANMVPQKACSELPASANAADDKAYQNGCRPFAAHPPAFAPSLKLQARLFRPMFPMTLEVPVDSQVASINAATLRRSTASSNFAPCDPLAQTGCATNEKCTWIIDMFTGNTPTGHVGCAPSGGKALGEACMFGAGGAMATGADNCQKGAACNTGVCKTVCNPEGGAPACGATASCARYGNLFGNQGEVAVAGVCDPNCDPLTQTAGTVVACGSPDPLHPTKGCYGFWTSGGKTRFSCAAAGNLDAKQDFVLTNVFINSCAPGFFAGLSKGTGTMQTICSAFCNPADVYQGHDQGKGGVLLPGNPTALATCGDRGAL